MLSIKKQILIGGIFIALCMGSGLSLSMASTAYGQTTSTNSSNSSTSAKPATKLPSKTKLQMGLSAKKAPEAVKQKPRTAASWGKPVSNQKKSGASSQKIKQKNSPTKKVGSAKFSGSKSASKAAKPTAKSPKKSASASKIVSPKLNSTADKPKHVLPAPVVATVPVAKAHEAKLPLHSAPADVATIEAAENHDIDMGIGNSATSLLYAGGLLLVLILVGFVAYRKKKAQKEAASEEAAAIINGSGTSTSSMAVSMMQTGAGKTALTGSMPQTGVASHIGKMG